MKTGRGVPRTARVVVFFLFCAGTAFLGGAVLEGVSRGIGQPQMENVPCVRRTEAYWDGYRYNYNVAMLFTDLLVAGAGMALAFAVGGRILTSPPGGLRRGPLLLAAILAAFVACLVCVRSAGDLFYLQAAAGAAGAADPPLAALTGGARRVWSWAPVLWGGVILAGAYVAWDAKAGGAARRREDPGRNGLARRMRLGA